MADAAAPKPEKKKKKKQGKARTNQTTVDFSIVDASGKVVEVVRKKKKKKGDVAADADAEKKARKKEKKRRRAEATSDGDGGGDGGGDGDRRLAAGNPCLPLPTTPGRAAFDVCEVPATSLAGLSVGLDQDTSIALEDAGEGENGVPFDAFVKHEGDGSYSVAFADRCGPAKLREIALTFELGVHGELCLEDDAFDSFALHDLSNVVAEPAFTSCNGGLGSSHTFTISDATDLPAERRAVAVGYRDYVSALRISVRGAVTVKGDADAVCDDPVPDDEPKSMLGRLAGFW
mmetsp:Transcript_19553/g.57897  ORF Transcript_19553/g.57897 Transcript_19553/m.57897 type:complete len:289 (-) Transcript_19553:194-1060(-)